MKTFFVLTFTISLLFITSCSKDQTKEQTGKDKDKKKNQTQNEAPLDSAAFMNSSLKNFNPEDPDAKKYAMPNELLEISGLTVTPDGRLFAHQDEKGIIFQIDMNNGAVIKSFNLGSPVLKEDFEDLAFVNGKFYMVKSNGDLYEFSEGDNNATVDYKIINTGLQQSNDVEGLCYDPETNSLLLACKGESGISGSKDKAVYSFSLTDNKLAPEPRFILQSSELKGFDPSGIEKNPATGTFYLISSTGNAIIELSKDGKLIGKKPLSKSAFEQPEGIGFSSNNELIISSEGKKGPGMITIFPVR